MRTAISIDSVKTDFDIAIGGLRQAMSLIVIWPQMPQRFYLTIIWLIYLIGFVIAILASYAGTLGTGKDLERVVAGLGQSIPMTVIVIKYALFKAQMNPLKSILKGMEDDWKNQKRSSTEDNNDRGIMLSHARISKIFFNLYITIVIVCWGLFVVAPLARIISHGNKTRNSTDLPMNSWYPFLTPQSSMYQIAYVFEVVWGTGMVIAHTSIDGLLVAIIFHLCGQLEILRCRIEDFGTKEHTTDMMIAQIKSIVIKHESIINSARALEESFNHILLGQLLGGTLHICLAGFSILQAMESSNPTAFAQFGLLLTMALQQMFIYSFAGDYLTTQGAVIRMAAYKANWYEIPPLVGRSFLLIMVRAARPINLTAGKFSPMSLASFTRLLKSAVSYLSVLRAMNQDKFN